MVVSTEVKRGRQTNRMHGIVRLKKKEAVEALLLCQHQVATRLGWSIHLKKLQIIARGAGQGAGSEKWVLGSTSA